MVFLYITFRSWSSKFKGYMSFLKIRVEVEVIKRSCKLMLNLVDLFYLVTNSRESGTILTSARYK